MSQFDSNCSSHLMVYWASSSLYSYCKHCIQEPSSSRVSISAMVSKIGAQVNVGQEESKPNVVTVPAWNTIAQLAGLRARRWCHVTCVE
jgi:hypothetical protein